MRDPDLLMIPFEEAERRLDAAARGGALPAETISTRDAEARVLSAEARSRLELPPFDKSAVDGYALGAPVAGEPAAPDGTTGSATRGTTGGPIGGTYRVAGVVHAGAPPGPPLAPGTAVKVMTGAPVPAGTLRVAMVEHTAITGDEVRLLRDDGARNFCLRGEDLRPDDLVLPAGTRLQAVDLGILIGAGLTRVEVARRPRVAVLSTGDEIVDDPAELTPGRIMNSNGPMLAALVRAHSLDLTTAGRVPDDPDATRSAIGRALDDADLLLVSGGVSEGDSDFVAGAIEALGLTIHFTRVAVKPGKPLTFASAAGRFILGLPGNPVSVYLMFHLCALRLAAHLEGAEPSLRSIRLPLAAPFRRRRANRLEFVPATLEADGRLRPIALHGSAHLHAISSADGFFRVPVDATEIPAGQVVQFHPIGRGLAP